MRVRSLGTFQPTTCTDDARFGVQTLENMCFLASYFATKQEPAHGVLISFEAPVLGFSWILWEHPLLCALAP